MNDVLSVLEVGERENGSGERQKESGGEKLSGDILGFIMYSPREVLFCFSKERVLGSLEKWCVPLETPVRK